MNPKISNTTKSGFTIVELIVVIVVIAVLASITLVSYRYLQTRAADTATAANVKQYVDALEMYAFEHARYPSEMGCLGRQPAGVESCAKFELSGSCSQFDGMDLSGTKWNDSLNKALEKYMGEQPNTPQYAPYRGYVGEDGGCSMYVVGTYPVYQTYNYVTFKKDGSVSINGSSGSTNDYAYSISYSLQKEGAECPLDKSKIEVGISNDGTTCYVYGGNIIYE